MTAREDVSLWIELNIQLRYADADDLPKLEWYGQYSHYRGLYQRAYQEQLQGRRLMLVAECGGFPIGQVFVQFNSADPMVADGDTRGYLYSLRVMEMFRGHGIGTRLIEEAEGDLVDRGFQWATIAVAKTNDGALRLYQRNGYRRFREDEGRWSYRDERGQRRAINEPCWILEKRISGALDLHR